MKTISLNFRSGSVHFITLTCSLTLVSIGHGQNDVRPPMRTAPTNEQLILQLKQSDQERSSKAIKPSTLSSSVDPTVVNQPEDLISRSAILCFNGFMTLVPKRAVLQFPKNLADRMKPQPGAQIKTWSDFYVSNRSWITTVEVSRIQAEGKQPLPKETCVQMAKSGNLIVATFNGNPISVLPLKAPELPVTPANTPNSQL